MPSPEFVVWLSCAVRLWRQREPAVVCFGGGCGWLRRPVLCGRQRGVVDERDPLVASLYGYSGHLGGRPFADAQVEVEEVVVQYRQAHQCGVLGPESPDRLEPVLKLAVEPLVGIVVIELLFHVDLPDVDQPEAGPAQKIIFIVTRATRHHNGS